MKKFTLLAVATIFSMSLFAQKAPVSQKNLRTVVTNNPVNHYVSGRFTPPGK